MGKPSSSCLKIIACGSDSPVEDDIVAPEARGSSDKRGWSFRKRSARHRVLSNSVTTENLTLGDKVIPQSTFIPSQIPADPASAEKIAALKQSDEKHLPPSLLEVEAAKSSEPELSETLGATKPPKSVQPEVSETLHASNPQEAVEQEVSEAVHASEEPKLVEQNTYETVITSEIIAAVVSSTLEPPVPSESKISEGVVTAESLVSIEQKPPETQDEALEEPMILDIQDQRELVKLQAAVRGHLVRRQAVDTLYCIQSIVKVQSLVRARHSKPSGEEILVDKPMPSHSSVENLLRNAFARQLLQSTPKSKSTVIKCDPLMSSPSRLWLERWMALYSYGLANLEKKEIGTDDGRSQRIESEHVFEFRSESINPKFAVKKASKTSDNGRSSISLDPAEDCQTSTLVSNKEEIEQPCGSSAASFEGSLGIARQKGQSKRSRSRSLSDDLAVETEDTKISTKRMASKHGEVESKKFAHGSRKLSNPAFIAAQSKFKELSSNHQASSGEYHLDTASSREEVSGIKETELLLESGETRFNIAGSEHGTELSVTSALDSPYLSEAEAVEADLDIKYTEEKSSIAISNASLEVKAKGSSSVQVSYEQDNGEYDDLKRAADSQQVEQKPEIHTSPNNTQRTPSSQVSGKVKRSKADKSGSNGKHSSLSGGKRTPTKPLDDSGVRSSGEKLSKDEKRRNSFGSAKSENIDQEPRDSTSSNKTLPSYMQATTSARAKAHSPRSSPDVQDKEAYMIKKRHSLPGASGRQGSPRVQRPTAQALLSQQLKGNANTPPQERKWIR